MAAQGRPAIGLHEHKALLLLDFPIPLDASDAASPATGFSKAKFDGSGLDA
jgi:hypothetical protein